MAAKDEEAIFPIPSGKHGNYGNSGGGVAVDPNPTDKPHSWDFLNIIQLPKRVTAPRLYCPLDDHTLALGDTMGGVVYTVDLVTGEATKRELGGHIMDCALMADGTLVASEYPSGSIAVHDRDGKRVRNVRLPDTQSQSNVIACDKNGLIVASPVCGDSNKVYFVDPKSGQPVKMGTVDAEDIRGEIDVAFSGSIVVKTDDDEFTILDGDSARVRSKLTREEWYEARCGVDPFSDILYVCYIRDVDAKPAVAVIDEVSVDGGMLKRGVLEFKQLVRPAITPLLMPNGQLVVCNGKELLVYKKIYSRAMHDSQRDRKWLKV